jgi:hypothetical protein
LNPIHSAFDGKMEAIPPTDISNAQPASAPNQTKITLQTNMVGLAMTPSTVNTCGHGSNDNSTVASVDIYSHADSPSVSSVSCNSSVETVGDQHNERMNEAVIDDLTTKAIDFEVNSPSDAAIGIGSFDDSLKYDEIMHRNQLLDENDEYDLCMKLPSEDSMNLKSEMHVKDVIMESQRNELQRYNNLIKKYRTRIREKNSVIQSMENSLERLRNEGDVHGIPLEGGNGAINQSFDGTYFSNAESSCEEATLQAVQSELRTYKQIIAALTDENNEFRQKDMMQLEKINALDKEAKSRVRPSEQELQRLKDNVEMKTKIAENLIEEMTMLKGNDNNYQVQIAELGQEVIRTENENIFLEEENKTLQKLLHTSREAVTNRSMESLNESQLDIDNINLSFQSGYSEIMEDSLRNELQTTKKREAKLLEQMANMCHKGDDRDAIMESLSDSQQEAIVYLTGELEVLRTQIDEERHKSRAQNDAEEKVKAMVHILEHENKLAVAETIRNENLLEKVQQNLSIKSGENACLRDEVSELEEKSLQFQALESSLKDMEQECRHLNEINKDLLAASTSGEILTPKIWIPPPQSASRSRQATEEDTMSEADNTLISVEIDTDNIETEILNQTKPSDQDAALRKFHVLKKALKQTYEKKQKELEEALQNRELELEKLTLNLKEQKSCQQQQHSELENLEIHRISNEAEMYEHIQALQMSIKERDSVLNAMKVKMHKLQDRCNGEARSWSAVSGISDALINGVEKSIELFESLSFGNDEHEVANEDYRTRAPLSSKSFG